MTTPLRRRTFAAMIVAAGTALSGTSFAQADKPLRVILPVSAGSGVDGIVRAASPSLTKALGGQPIVVENLPGAGGITGTAQLVKAAPDGKTIAFVSNNHAVNPSVFKKMPFDSLKDITPITVVGETPFVLVVNPSRLPVKNAKELVAALKARPDFYNMASSGNGTIIHLAGEMFVDAAGAKVRHIPYKGVGPMVTDLIGGQIDFATAALPSVQQHIASGALRPIGALTPQRAPAMANVPTFAEQGLANFAVEAWFAVIGPKGMSAANVKKAHDAVVAAFADPAVKEAMAKQGNTIQISSSEQAQAAFRAELAKYAALVKKVGLEPQ